MFPIFLSSGSGYLVALNQDRLHLFKQVVEVSEAQRLHDLHQRSSGHVADLLEAVPQQHAHLNQDAAVGPRPLLQMHTSLSFLCVQQKRLPTYPGRWDSMTCCGRLCISLTMANAMGTLATSSSFMSLDLTALCSSSRFTCMLWMSTTLRNECLLEFFFFFGVGSFCKRVRVFTSYSLRMSCFVLL